MSEKEPHIAVIAGTEGTARMLCNQLAALLGDEMTFHPYAVHEWDGNAELDLVLFSSHILFTRHSPIRSSDNNEIIIMKRTLTRSGWELIRHLPAGSRCLVVNDERDSVVETISLLYEAGLRDVDLIPYYPGLPDKPDIDTAITPGEPQLVPASVRRTIDIGARVVDPATVLEIWTRLNRLNHGARAILNEYSGHIVTLSQGLQTTMQGLIDAKHLFEETLNMVQDGVMTYDGNGMISFLNRTAEEIFGFGLRETAGKPIEFFFDKQGLSRQLLHEQEEVRDALVTVKKQTFILNKMRILGRGGQSESVLIFKIAKKVEELELKLRTQLAEKGHAAKFAFKDIVTHSEQMERLIAKAQKMAKNDSSVLLLGENGTGKELFAHSIHNHSLRSAYPFIPVNCGALSESLLESELFGYEEGAFTGARRGGKPGLFEQAHKGTIFLDEIGDISPNLQTRLLRVLQQKEVLKVGGTKVLPVDVRVIAATNRDLRRMVKEGQFREDLYYRLKVLQIEIPPLRDRREDIPLLTRYFLERRNYPFALSDDVMNSLVRYEWPGNIRELENTIEYISIMSEGDFAPEELPFMTEGADGLLPEKDRSDAASGSERGDSGPAASAVPAGALEIDTATFLLEIILDARQKRGHTGRRNLIAIARERGVLFTESEMRRWVERLRTQRFIEVNIGRSGCTLTAEGYRYLTAAATPAQGSGN